jgi:hypothetical protein
MQNEFNFKSPHSLAQFQQCLSPKSLLRFMHSFLLDIFFIYISNAILKVPYTLHSWFLVLTFPYTGAYNLCKTKGLSSQLWPTRPSSATHSCTLLTLIPYKIKTKSHASNIQWHRRYITTTKQGGEHDAEIINQSKTENQLSKLQTLYLDVWRQNALQISNSFQLY